MDAVQIVEIITGLTLLAGFIALFILSLISEPKIYSVFIHDKYYDFKLDNDDLEDTPTIVCVTYNDRGKILSVHFADTTSDLCDNESPIEALSHFYRTCKIDPAGGLNEFKKYTIYREYYKVYGKH